MTTRRSKTLKTKGRKTIRATASRPSAAAGLRKRLDQQTRELAKTQKLLTEALQQQTATADVLKVISRSAFDLQAVLNTLVESAVTLSGGSLGTIFQRRGELFHLTAAHGYWNQR